LFHEHRDGVHEVELREDFEFPVAQVSDNHS
jgi:hypothetical protein